MWYLGCLLLLATPALGLAPDSEPAVTHSHTVGVGGPAPGALPGLAV